MLHFVTELSSTEADTRLLYVQDQNTPPHTKLSLQEEEITRINLQVLPTIELETGYLVHLAEVLLLRIDEEWKNVYPKPCKQVYLVSVILANQVPFHNFNLTTAL